MSINEILNNITAGGILSVLIILSMLVEITPVKFSPLNWIGKRINADVYKRLDEIEKRIDKVDGKVDEHVAESYRNNIFRVQDRLLKGDKLTLEEWKKTIKSCESYHTYVETNDLENELAEQAIKYIYRKYNVALDEADFINL